MKRLTRLAALALRRRDAGASRRRAQRAGAGELRVRFPDRSGHGQHARRRRRTFQTYVAILNPTASAFPVNVSLYDARGDEARRHDHARRGRAEDVRELPR